MTLVQTSVRTSISIVQTPQFAPYRGASEVCTALKDKLNRSALHRETTRAPEWIESPYGTRGGDHGMGSPNPTPLVYGLLRTPAPPCPGDEAPKFKSAISTQYTNYFLIITGKYSNCGSCGQTVAISRAREVTDG